MKKILSLVGGAVALMFVAAGCTTVNTNDAASDSKQAMVPAVYESVIAHKNQKVRGEASMHVLFGVFKWGANKFADRTSIGGASANSFFANMFPNYVRDAKAAAVYNACAKEKCDLLLGAKYEITVNDFFVYKFVNCKVAGFPGTEKGVLKKDVAFPKSFNGSMVITPVSLD